MFAAVPDYPAIISALATVVLAVLTIIYVALTSKLVRAQSEGCVVVYPMLLPGQYRELAIVIENVGHGLARNIKFSLPQHLSGLPTSTAGPFLTGPLVDGLPALGPGERRLYYWGTLSDLLEKHAGDKINITVKHDGFNDVGLESISNDCVLSVDSFRKSVSLPDPLTRIANALERISIIKEDE